MRPTGSDATGQRSTGRAAKDPAPALAVVMVCTDEHCSRGAEVLEMLRAPVHATSEAVLMRTACQRDGAGCELTTQEAVASLQVCTPELVPVGNRRLLVSCSPSDLVRRIVAWLDLGRSSDRPHARSGRTTRSPE